MGINQLFRVFVPFEVVNEISNLININLIDLKNNTFTKKNLNDHKISEKFPEIQNILKKYYIPCKYNNYLENLNINKFITVYRQILKLHNFILKSNDKYEKGTKYIMYSVLKKQSKKELKHTEGIITFD